MPCRNFSNCSGLSQPDNGDLGFRGTAEATNGDAVPSSPNVFYDPFRPSSGLITKFDCRAVPLSHLNELCSDSGIHSRAGIREPNNWLGLRSFTSNTRNASRGNRPARKRHRPAWQILDSQRRFLFSPPPEKPRTEKIGLKTQSAGTGTNWRFRLTDKEAWSCL